jgi:hypothetical protein
LNFGSAGAVARATADCHQDEDALGASLDERCELQGEIAVVDFGEADGGNSDEIGEKPLSGAWLGRRLPRPWLPGPVRTPWPHSGRFLP